MVDFLGKKCMCMHIYIYMDACKDVNRCKGIGTLIIDIMTTELQ